MADAHARFGKRPAGVAPAVLAEIAKQAGVVAAADAASAGPQWGAMHKLLLKAKVDPNAIMRLVASRDAAGLSDLVRWLHGEEVAEAVVEARTGPTVDPEAMRSAMKVFRKRLRLARLDAESRLGVGPLSGGKRNEIDAIEAPREYPTAVWHALVAAGRLRYDGKGFYSLAVDDLGDD
ncbi:MAG: hypothetical protein RLZZ116_1873 [Planctomycetota bacterium]|jgi:hypothetical protein